MCDGKSKLSLDFVTRQLKENRVLKESGRESNWPSEFLIWMMSGSYIDNIKHDYAGKKVLDVGYGQGNNLLYLHSLGLDVHGIEIHEEMANYTSKSLDLIKGDLKLNVGTNRCIPYPDDYFDYVVSWYVIDYEKSPEDALEALAEYKRVLKPGGHLFMQAAGPEIFVLYRSIKVGNGVYKVCLEGDYRYDDLMFNFESLDNMQTMLAQYFSEVQVGRARFDFMDRLKIDCFHAGAKA